MADYLWADKFGSSAWNVNVFTDLQFSAEVKVNNLDLVSRFRVKEDVLRFEVQSTKFPLCMKPI